MALLPPWLCAMPALLLMLRALWHVALFFDLYSEIPHGCCCTAPAHGPCSADPKRCRRVHFAAQYERRGRQLVMLTGLRAAALLVALLAPCSLCASNFSDCKDKRGAAVPLFPPPPPSRSWSLRQARTLMNCSGRRGELGARQPPGAEGGDSQLGQICRADRHHGLGQHDRRLRMDGHRVPRQHQPRRLHAVRITYRPCSFA